MIRKLGIIAFLGIFLINCGGEEGTTSSRSSGIDSSDRSKSPTQNHKSSFLGRFRDISGSFPKNSSEDDPCPIDNVVFVDENRNSYSQSLDENCSFDTFVLKNKRYRAKLYKDNQFVAWVTFKNSADEEFTLFYLDDSTDAFQFGLMTLDGVKAWPENNPMKSADFDQDGTLDFDDPDYSQPIILPDINISPDNPENPDGPNNPVGPNNPDNPINPPENPPVDPYDVPEDPYDPQDPDAPIEDPVEDPQPNPQDVFWPVNLPDPEPLPDDLPPYNNQIIIKSPDPDQEDRLGYFHQIASAQTLDVSGNFMAVGAPDEDSSSIGIGGDFNNNDLINSGAVYIYEKINGVWNFHSYIKASNPQARAQFGKSIAMWNDLLVIGAPREHSNANTVNGDQLNENAPESGAVYIFRNVGNAWVQEAYLKASNNKTKNNFGTSVDVHNNRIVVGADGEDDTGVDGNGDFELFSSGAAYVFEHDGANWFQSAYLKADHVNQGDFFGTSVSIFDETIVIGARLEDSDAVGVDGLISNNQSNASGAAYIFTLNNNAWTQEVYIKPTHNQDRQMFGTKVAIWENTVAVSAPNEFSDFYGINGDASNLARHANSTNIGTVYIYQNINNKWYHTHYVKTPSSSSAFGSGLDLKNDQLVIGSPFATTRDDPQVRGGVFVYQKDQNQQWQLSHEIYGVNTEANDFFGGQVSISENQIMTSAFGNDSQEPGIGADDLDNSASDSGVIYILE